MDGKRLAQGLIGAEGEDLRLVYALLVETKMLDLLVAKAKDVFNKDVDHFEQQLKKEMKELAIYTDEELQLRLFLYLQEQLGLHGAHYNLVTEIELKCEEIVTKAHNLQKRQDKEYAQFAEGREEDFSVILVLYQMRKIFQSFDAQMNNLSEADTERLVEQIDDYIQALPEEKQQKIKERLNIDDLTNKTLNQILLTQGTTVLITIIVEVAGFTAFTTLTSVIAATAGFFGLTLPFGAYVFATSALSILTGPIGIALIALGGGAILNYQNKKVRKSMIPIGVVQLLLPIIIEGEKQIDYRPFMNEWKKCADEQEQLLEEQKQAEKQKLDLNSQLKKLEFNQKALSKQLLEKRSIYSQCLEYLIQHLATIKDSEKSNTYTSLSEDLKTINSEKKVLRDEILLNKQQTGFFNSVKNMFTNTSLQGDIKKLEAEYEEMKNLLAQEIVLMRPNNLKDICKRVEEVSTDISSTSVNIADGESYIEETRKDIRFIEAELKEIAESLKNLQKKWYGLKDIV